MSGIQNLDKLFKKLDKLDKVEALKPIMSNVGAFVRDDARALAPIGPSGGDLQKSIDFEVIVEGTKVMAIVFAGSDHAPYVEFGTGPKGRENHEGISPNVDVRYRVDGWMIPAKDIDPKIAEQYHFIKVIKGGQLIGYLTYGQPAQPFMYPAFKDNVKQVKKYIKKQMKKVILDAAND